MQIIIKGKQMEVTPRLRRYIERKAQKLSRLLSPHDTLARAEVTITEEQTRSAQDHYTVQILLAGNGPTLRSEVSALSASAAFDLALDKVLVQLSRQKDRITSARRHQRSPVRVLALARSGALSSLERGSADVVGERGAAGEEDEYSNLDFPASVGEEQNEAMWARIREIRSVPTKPMSDREAILQMEALGLPFYPFLNEATNTVNVMYRLEKGGYGLLIPSLE
jgi:putative sigma-54 modulation protein